MVIVIDSVCAYLFSQCYSKVIYTPVAVLLPQLVTQHCIFFYGKVHVPVTNRGGATMSTYP